MISTPLPLLRSLVLLAGLTVGAKVPDFSAKNQDSKEVKLSDFKGKKLLVYFYPKDDTPGCTKEACSLRDEYGKFTKAGIAILGVSRQDAESHKAFRAKFHLPFDLLTDEDGALAKQLGVETMLIVGYHKRQSLLIDEGGKVVRFFDDVDPTTHTAAVMKAFEEAGKAPATK